MSRWLQGSQLIQHAQSKPKTLSRLASAWRAMLKCQPRPIIDGYFLLLRFYLSFRNVTTPVSPVVPSIEGKKKQREGIGQSFRPNATCGSHVESEAGVWCVVVLVTCFGLLVLGLIQPQRQLVKSCTETFFLSCSRPRCRGAKQTHVMPLHAAGVAPTSPRGLPSCP